MDIRRVNQPPTNRLPELTAAEERHRRRIALGEALLAESERRHRRKYRLLGGLLFFFFVFLVFPGVLSILMADRVYQTTRTITVSDTGKSFVENENQTGFVREAMRAGANLTGNKRTPLRGEERGRTNILLLGKGTSDHPGKNLTDTIMIASIDTQKRKVALLSLPRDMYVKTPSLPRAMKINSLYQYGLSTDKGLKFLQEAVEEVTGLEIHYFLLADFDAFVSVVDALGGINVDVPRDIRDTRYPGPNYSYQTFEISKGLHKMDGQTALKYVRTRHGDPEGDFGRAKRQQQVLQAIKNKAFSLGTLVNPRAVSKLLDAVADNIRTNMSLSDMTSLLNLSKNLDTQNIVNVVVDAWKPDSLLRVAHFGEAFGLVPRTGRFNYGEIRDLAENIFDRAEEEARRERIRREKPRLVIFRAGAKPKTARYVRELVADVLGIKKTDILVKNLRQKSERAVVIFDRTDRGKPFTLDALRKTLNAEITDEAPPETGKFDAGVILGSGADQIFDMAAISREEFEAWREKQVE